MGKAIHDICIGTLNESGTQRHNRRLLEWKIVFRALSVCSSRKGIRFNVINAVPSTSHLHIIGSRYIAFFLPQKANIFPLHPVSMAKQIDYPVTTQRGRFWQNVYQVHEYLFNHLYQSGDGGDVVCAVRPRCLSLWFNVARDGIGAGRVIAIRIGCLSNAMNYVVF